MNNFMAVGRVTKQPTTIFENEKEKTIVNMALNRNYKNNEGFYEVDFIPVTLWEGVAITCLEYIKPGDVIGIRGRIESNEGKLEIIAERLTFISSSRKDNEE